MTSKGPFQPQPRWNSVSECHSELSAVLSYPPAPYLWDVSAPVCQLKSLCGSLYLFSWIVQCLAHGRDQSTDNDLKNELRVCWFEL